MANQVYANNMEVSCRAGSGKSICAFPDVCFTPPQTPATPPGVPVPYPNTGMASDTTDGSSTVTVSGNEVMLKNKSYYKTSTGDEAGCAPKKGMITSTTKGKVYYVAWSMDVKIEGENVDRHLDLTTHNHGSNPNEGIAWPNVAKPTKPGKFKKLCGNDDCPKGTVDYEKLRAASPDQKARDTMNERIKPPPRKCITCPRTPERLTADHIFPLNEIKDMDGFACLPFEEQKKIANNDANYAGMCRSCNSSKQDYLWGEWKEHKRREFSIDKSVQETGKKKAVIAKAVLKKAIEDVPC
jgi:hypothetical protein